MAVKENGNVEGYGEENSYIVLRYHQKVASMAAFINKI